MCEFKLVVVVVVVVQLADILLATPTRVFRLERSSYLAEQ
jgi:hypothetical protein